MERAARVPDGEERVNEGLMAGFSRSDISPAPGIELAGYPHHPRPNTGVRDPLYASCLYLDDGRTAVAIVSLDILMISRRVARAIRERIGRETPVPAGNVMILCSHTHSGPWASGRLDLEAIERGLAPDAGWLERLQGAVVSCVAEAGSARFPAAIGVERGFCGKAEGVGGNRRDPGELADPEVWVIGVRDLAGALRGCLVRYALHPTFLHSDNTLASADYPGCIRARLAAIWPGAAFLFAQGASGNQSPRYFRSGKTYAEAVRVGTAIANEAARVLDGMSFSASARLSSRSAEVSPELRRLPPRAEAEASVERFSREWEAARAAGLPERDVWNAELRLLGAEDTLGYVRAAEAGRSIDLVRDELPAEIQVVGIGQARIVGLPGELFAELGMTIQYRAPFDKVIVATLANGCLPGYACTERAYAQGGYEAGTSLLTGRAGEQLVDAAAALLRETRGAS
jgi:neutral ceramidase